MRWFNNIKIRNKLFFLFGILAFIIISFTVFSVTQIISLGNNINILINSYQARQIYISDAITDLYKMRHAIQTKGYLVEDNILSDLVPIIEENFETSVSSFMENLIGFRYIIANDPKFSESRRQEGLAIDSIQDSFLNYLEAAKKIEKALLDKDSSEILNFYAEIIPIGNQLSGKVEDLRDLLFYTTKSKTLETAKAARNTVNIIFILTILFIFLSCFALLYTVNNITKPIIQLEKATNEIKNGNLSYPIRNERNDELGSLSTGISEMVIKLTEHDKIMAIMDNLDTMIYVTDLDYNLLFINTCLIDIYSIDRDNYVNQKCYNVIRKRDTPCSFCQIPNFLPNVHAFPSADFEYIWDDFLNIWLGGSNSIIHWVDGSLAFFQTARDVSNKKQQEELLQEALENAKTASISKSSFLANMSHEIRTPMNAILGITDIIMQNEALDPNTLEALQKIYNSGDLLLSIINDILDFSKIEAGKLEIIPLEYEVASLINDIVTLNIMKIGSKRIKFQLYVDPNIPSNLLGDELRIKQILNNLLSNAFKYTDSGVVKLSVMNEIDSAAENASEINLLFTVSDTGQGMTADEIDHLFSEYTRFNLKTNRSIEGTGLGLSITYNLIKMMNGTINVESKQNSGSVFTVRLPQGSSKSPVLGVGVAENLQNFRFNMAKHIKRSQVVFEAMPYGKVLIVDDVESNLYVAKGILTPYKLSIDTATSGFEAIDKIREGNIYNIIFMDHMMPKMDGIETTKKLREEGYNYPIVALTANAVSGQSEMFLANGFDDFISKPIDIRQLNAALKKFIRDRQPPQVLEEASRVNFEKENNVFDESSQVLLDPQLAGIFIQDAKKAMLVIDKFKDGDIKAYSVAVHGMKSTLLIIGEDELSAFAAKLEKAGREKNIKLINAETPLFLEDLKKVLKKLGEIVVKKDEAKIPDKTSEELRSSLQKKLLSIKEACGNYDQKTAKTTLNELRQEKLQPAFREALDIMADHLLGGDFENVSLDAAKVMEMI